MSTALYRFFDAEGTLLYVGITHRLNERLAAHKKEKPWEQVSNVTVEHFPTREQAVEAEKTAIWSENPQWNIVHSSAPVAPKFESGSDLVGHFFHTFTEEDDGCLLVQWQGQIIGQVAENLYLIETYEWLMGEPHSRHVVDVADIQGWELYEDADWMKYNYEYLLSSRRDRHESHLDLLKEST